MVIFLVAFAAAGLIILAAHATLAVGLLVNFARDGARARSRDRTAARPTLRAEVIVAVRDEADNLPRLLESLSRQSDPEFLVLFVDDRSTDGSSEILDGFSRSFGPRAAVIHNTREPIGLTGKQAALDIAFQAARGDVLLFTDGDCVVSPGWVCGMLSYFDDPSVGVVLGRIELEGGGGVLSRFQAFEQPMINQYNFGAAGIGLPMGCFGNNMAVRAEAIRMVGGFAGLGYSVTEDAALLSAVSRRTRLAVRVSTLQETSAVTRPKRRWADYINQHTRWNAGAFFADDWKTRAAYGFIVCYLIFCIFAFPLGLVDVRITLISLNAFVSMGLLGFFGGLYAGKNKTSYFLFFIPFLIFFGFFYSFVSIRALVRRPFDWKGSLLSPRRPGA
jgi:cellulose synthase/poly-beta-1,6-N-acetylglucosamine synthase-like glycosyltransferase